MSRSNPENSRPPEVTESNAPKNLVLATVTGLILVMVLIMVLGLFFRRPLTHIAVITLEAFGLPGLFVGIVLSDAFSFPIPPSAYFIISIAAEANPVVIVAVTSVASLVGGSIAYLCGPYLVNMPLLGDRFEVFRQRTEHLYARWGLWSVGIAAISPIPFAFACWMAGVYRAPFGKFFAVMLLRIPRFAVYYAIFVFGWASATAV